MLTNQNCMLKEINNRLNLVTPVTVSFIMLCLPVHYLISQGLKYAYVLLSIYLFSFCVGVKLGMSQ